MPPSSSMRNVLSKLLWGPVRLVVTHAHRRRSSVFSDPLLRSIRCQQTSFKGDPLAEATLPQASMVKNLIDAVSNKQSACSNTLNSGLWKQLEFLHWIILLPLNEPIKVQRLLNDSVER